MFPLRLARISVENRCPFLGREPIIKNAVVFRIDSWRALKRCLGSHVRMPIVDQLLLVGRAQERRDDVVPSIGQVLVRLNLTERVEKLPEHEAEPCRRRHKQVNTACR